MKTAQSRRIQRAMIAPMMWMTAMMAVYWYTAIFMSIGPVGPIHGAEEAIRQTDAMKQQARIKVAVLVGEVVVMGAGGYVLAIRARRKGSMAR